MDYFFKPKGIAVIGASPNKKKGGNALLRNIMSGYKGNIFPINPQYETIEDLKCYPSVSAVEDNVDLAILFVSANMVPEVLRDCAAKGVSGAIIQSGGFAETGPEGRALQEKIKKIGKEGKIRLWGPNCMGMVDMVQKHIFSFVNPKTIQSEMLPGDVSLVVQSGMLSASFLVDIMSHGATGISKVCSVGNKVDVDECDLLEYLCDDPNTKAIGFYLESFSDGRRFANVCRNSTKPIVVLKGGKSQRGAEAAMSHTASMAGNYKVTRGVMAQSGIIEAKDFKQMVDLCRSLAACGSIRKENRDGRIAIISFSGGAGIVASDFIEEQNLKVADLSDKTVGTLKEIYPKWMPVANPIDLWPAIEINGAAKAYNTATEAVLGDPGIDAVIIQVMAGNPVFEVDLTNIAAMAKKADKPVFFWLIGRRDDEANFQSASRDYRLPAFTELFRAVECMSAVFRFGGRDGYSDASKSIEAASGDREKTVNQALNNSLDNKFGPLDEHASKTFLAACGIPVVEEKIADNYPSLKDIIASSKYPVVMKGLPERVEIHKTDRGLVKLNIKSEEEAKNTFETLMNNMGGKGRVLVYSQVGGRFELIAGLIRDQEFGPCVMLGVGGIMAEVINDVAFAMAPLSISDALMMMDNLRSRKMFDGFRGEKAADKKKVAQLLVDLGNIGVNYPRIKEIDVNPFIISESEPIAVDASIILTEEDKKK